MARLFTCGFETTPVTAASEQSYSFEGQGVGAVTRDTTVKRSGLSSRKCDTTGSNSLAYSFHTWVNQDLTLTLGRGWYWRIYFQVDSLPSSSSNMFLRFATATAGTFCAARLLTTGEVVMVDSSVAQVGSPSAEIIVPGTWYRLELYGKAGSGSTDEGALRLNGNLVASATGQTWSESGIDRGYSGWSQVPGASKVIYIDDMALNEEVGTTENSWPGPGKIIYLNPTADAAVGGSWTAGAGATTNLYQAVDNDPPAGLADASATNASQIKNSNAADTTGNYDVTMQTYEAAGLPVNANVRLVQPVANHGRQGANVGGALLVLSNPAGTEQSFAIGRGANIDTYPTAWATRWGNAVENPTIARATAPVVRLGKRDANVTAHVAGIRMAVEYVDSFVLPHRVVG